MLRLNDAGDKCSAAELQEWQSHSLRWMETSFVEGEKTVEHKAGKTQYRLHSAANLLALDRQLRVGSGLSLADFVYKDPLKMPGAPQRQNILTMGCDQASTNWALSFFLMHHCGVSMVVMPDYSHGMDNDVCGAAKQAGLWPYVVWTTIVINMPWGPWAGQMFWGKLTLAWKEYMAHADNKRDALFQSLVDRIARDKGIDKKMYEGDLEDILWGELASGTDMQTKGTKVSLTRWFGWHKAYKSLDVRWHTWLCFLIFLGTRLDWFRKEVETLKKPSEKDKKGDEYGNKLGTSKGPPSEVSRLTAACSNRMHFSTLVLLDCAVQNHCRVVLTFAEPFMKCHGLKNQEGRNVYSLEARAAYFSLGSELKPIAEAFSLFGNEPALEYCGVIVAPSAKTVAALGEDSGLLDEQDCLVSTIWEYVLALARGRVRRQMYALFGWPYQLSVLVLKEPAKDDQCLASLKDVVAAFEAAKLQKQNKTLGRIFTESILEQSVNKMAISIAAQANYEPTAMLREIASTVARSLPTQLVEDGFNSCRDHETRVSKSGESRSAAVWAKLISDSVISSKHDFREVDPRGAPIDKGPRVRTRLRGLHTPVWKDASMPKLKEIVGPSQRPSWPTCNADSWTTRFTDLLAIQEAHRRGVWTKLEDAWLCGLLVPGILVKGPGMTEFVLSLGFVGGTAAMGWPVKDIGDRVVIEQDMSQDKLVPLVVWDLHEWTGIQVQAVSPLRQIMKGKGNTGIKLAKVSKSVNVLTLAARSCFWKLSATWLKKLAEHLELAAPDKTLGGRLASLANNILKPSDGELLRILQMRVCNTDRDAAVMSLVGNEELADAMHACCRTCT